MFSFSDMFRPPEEAGPKGVQRSRSRSGGRKSPSPPGSPRDREQLATGTGGKRQLVKSGNLYHNTLPRSRDPSTSISTQPTSIMPSPDVIRRNIERSEAFKKKMKEGLVVTKYKNSGKAVRGSISCNNNFTFMRWTKTEPVKFLGIKIKMDSKIKSFPLTQIVEVNTGTQPDPDNPHLPGSTNLRQAMERGHLDAANRACSIKFEDDFKLDLSFEDTSECNYFVDELRIQVFKVKLQDFQRELKEKEGSSNNKS
mmetsp:Transcript_24412/g.31885  ORF Transcript_24412/g.31885 Transcript_24412/m.31885 type:complete len:254 (+) Transcript_24412:351-1112(+)